MVKILEGLGLPFPAAKRSLKGAVKKNIPTPTGHRDEILLVAASPCSVETIC
jgi:hypothetical protein